MKQEGSPDLSLLFLLSALLMGWKTDFFPKNPPTHTNKNIGLLSQERDQTPE